MDDLMTHCVENRPYRIPYRITAEFRRLYFCSIFAVPCSTRVTQGCLAVAQCDSNQVRNQVAAKLASTPQNCTAHVACAARSTMKQAADPAWLAAEQELLPTWVGQHVGNPCRLHCLKDTLFHAVSSLLVYVSYKRAGRCFIRSYTRSVLTGCHNVASLRDLRIFKIMHSMILCMISKQRSKQGSALTALLLGMCCT